MGRYYQGDIEGKFMFGVQGSDAAERFGAVEREHDYVEYSIHRDNYKEIVEELESIKSANPIEKVVSMFETVNFYNKENTEVKNFRDFFSWEETLKKHGLTLKDLSAYADHRLGKQIKDWFDENPKKDYLTFSAEL